MRLAWERRRPSARRSLVVVGAALAGLQFGASALTARGFELRCSGARGRLTDLIATQQRSASSLEANAARLRAQVEAGTAEAALGSSQVSALRRANDTLG